MADIQYLNYGDQQVEQQALLTNLANEVNNYVNSQPWSRKRKEKFMSAYSDLMNRGIQGASNTTGQWMLQVGGDDIDLNSMDRKDREMYEEAAYFIRNQMGSLPTKTQETEKNKTKFNNKTFQDDLRKYIGNSFFGGQEFHIGGEKDKWNYLDERDTYGIRGRTNRTKKLAEVLKSYADSLDDNKYDFTDSPFKDLNDFKSRINGAITALNTENPDDDRDALNSLGLNFDDWFNNGSGDYTVDSEGNKVTYGQLAEAKMKLDEAEKAKLAEEEATKLAQEKAEAYEREKANKGLALKVSGIHGIDAKNTPQAYAKYISSIVGTGQQGFNNMNQLVQNLLEELNTGTLDSSKKRQLGNLLYYIRANNPNYQGLGDGTKTNVTDEEWNELFQYVGDSNKNNFIRLPWQTSDGKYVFADNKGTLYFLRPGNQKKFAGITVNRDQKYQNYLNNFLKGQGQIPRGGGVELTTADWVDLGALAADLVSIVDPEPISGAVLGVVAGAARATNKDWTNDFWSSLGSTVLDVGTGAIGGIPIVGDTILGSKVLKNAIKTGSRIGKYLNYYIASMSAGPAVDALKKIDFTNPSSFKNLTPDDYRTLYNVLQGILMGSRSVRGNLGQRKVLQTRGYEVSNRWDKKFGLTSTKAPKGETNYSVKVKVDGKDTDIPISKENHSSLKKKLQKAGNDVEAQNKAIRETPEVAEHIKAKKIEPEKVTVASKSSSLAGVKVGKHFGITPNRMRPVSQHFVTSSTVKRTNDDNFEEFLKNRGIVNKIRFGTNRTLRRIDKTLNLGNTTATSTGISENETSSKKQYNTAKIKVEERGSGFKGSVGKDIIYRRGVVKRYKDIQNGKFSSKNMETGEYNIGDEKVRIHTINHPDGNPLITLTTFKGSTLKGYYRFNTLNEAKKEVAKLIKNQRNNILEGKFNYKNMEKLGKVLQDLKRKGWLKQGGRITDTQIDNFLKQYK